jgi:hypothetical protein
MMSTATVGTAVIATAVAFASLVILHVVSPEFQPSWRMVSEYANGRHGWLLSIMFAGWGLGSLALAAALGPVIHGALGRVGLLFLVLAGIGEIMAAFFDINHRLHGAAAMIGVPSLPVAAVLLTIALRRSGELGPPPAWSMHLTWISLVLMGAAMMLFMRSLSQAGVDLAAQTGPLTVLPAGITPVVGWANRLLVAAYMLWVILAALPILRYQPTS